MLFNIGPESSGKQMFFRRVPATEAGIPAEPVFAMEEQPQPKTRRKPEQNPDPRKREVQVCRKVGGVSVHGATLTPRQRGA
jgi:hypothetical protein